ncbi:MAG: phosphate ABC transporter permease PstA [Opitutae bacterium]|nr:phosphate ABC transporter permease PstA [Opitutae bacterium]
MTNITTNARRRPLFFRKALDSAVGAFSIVAVAAAVGGMAWILFTVISHGVPAISAEFLTNPTKPYGIPEAGIANALIGTFFITLCAAILAVPPAIAAGIFLSEFGKRGKLAAALRFSANVMMGMPSVIVGLFVYTILVVPTGRFSGFAGAVSLAIIMFPVVMRTTEDMLGMVPNTLRESALALGMSRARTTLAIVCRSAKNGMLTGILLALARVSGETAPLLFTAMFADSWPTGFFSEPTANMPVLITEYATNSPFEEMHSAGWGAALVIAIVVLAINIFTRVVFRDKHKAH